MVDANEKLTLLSSHFEFGQNWAEYSRTIDEERIANATNNLSRLIGVKSLKDKTFLDIGSGSGIHSYSALKLGAKFVQAVDIDPVSIKTTKTLLSSKSNFKNWNAEVVSVFDLSDKIADKFDVVYSWGVLHHTGSMFRAIREASKMVKDDGLLVLALYRKTLLCPFWKIEKQVFCKLPSFAKKIVSFIYIAFYFLGLIVTGRSPITHIRNYREKRGMNFYYDVVDWLGGYPYESISFKEMVHFMKSLGFVLVQENANKAYSLGIFGSGCDEYTFRKSL